MRKQIPLNHNFDKEGLIVLLKKALDGRMQSDFSAKAGIDRSTLNRYLNGYYDYPPTPRTLRLISEVSDISYKEFLDVSGYDPDKYLKKAYDTKQNNLHIDKNSSSECRLFHEILLSNIQKKSFLWEEEAFDDPAALHIRLIKQPLKRWKFLYLTGINDTPSHDNLLHLYAFYGRIATLKPDSSTKYTIVTKNKIFHEKMISIIPPRMLYSILSVALIDPDKKTVLSETYAETAFEHHLSDSAPELML